MQKQEEEEQDIYQNLPDFEEYDVKLEKLQTSNECLKSKLQELEDKVDTLTKTNAKLTKVERALSRNISVLFTTALAEVQYKDKVIAELRKERDSLIFRRYHRRDPAVEVAPSPLLPQELLQHNESKTVSTFVPKIQSAHPEEGNKQHQDFHNSENKTSRQYKYHKQSDVSGIQNNTESSKHEIKESIQTVWGTSNKKSASSSYGITPLDGRVKSSSLSVDPKSLNLKKNASSSNSSEINKHTPMHASKIQPKKLDSKQDFIKSNDLSLKTISNVTILPKNNLNTHLEQLFGKDILQGNEITPIRNDSQKTFRIPKLVNTKISSTDVNTCVLGNPGIMNETMHDHSMQDRFQRYKHIPLKSENEELNNSVTESSETETKANIAVDASLSITSECVFSSRRKSRIKILSVSREENDIEEVPVVQTGMKRKLSVDSSEGKSSKILCSDIKLLDSSSICKDPSQKNNDTNYENIKTKTVSKEVKDGNFKEEHIVENQNSVVKYDNKLSVMSDNNSSLVNKERKKLTSEQKQHKLLDIRHRQKHNRDTKLLRENEHKPRNKDGDRLNRHHRDNYHNQEYQNKRRDGRYTRKSRSPSYDRKNIDSDHSKRSKNIPTFRDRPKVLQQHKRSVSSDSCKTSDSRNGKDCSNQKKRTTSPDLNLVEERARLIQQIETLRTDNNRRSDSPDGSHDGYLKTSLSDSYFSEDEEKLVQSIKKSSVKVKNSLRSSRRQGSVSDSDEVTRHCRNDFKRVNRSSRHNPPPNRRVRDHRTRSRSRSVDKLKSSAGDKHVISNLKGKDLRDKLSKSSKTSDKELIQDQTTLPCSQENDLKLSMEILSSNSRKTPEIVVKRTKKQILRLSYNTSDMKGKKKENLKKQDEDTQVEKFMSNNDLLEEGELSESD